MAMMDMFVRGLGNHEKVVKYSVARAAVVKATLAEKGTTHAQHGEALKKHNEAKVGPAEGLAAMTEDNSRRLECECLIKLLPTRKDVRASEIMYLKCDCSVKCFPDAKMSVCTGS